MDILINRIEAPCGNYYGSPAVWEENGKFYMAVENYDGWDAKIEVSIAFYAAWLAEFENK